jgi:hypothetical protein
MQKTSVTPLLALLLLHSAASYCSDPVYGYSANASAGGFNWSMSESVLGMAPVPGLDISGVLYRYTAVKNAADDFTVTIRNKNPLGGYVFQETDDWSGRPGATISKAIPIDYSPIRHWGEGSIETTGLGSVEDPQVVYTYRFIEPEIEVPVIELPPIDIYTALNDDAVRNATKETDRDLYDSESSEASNKDDEEKEDFEKALANSENALTLANDLSQAAMLQAMTPVSLNAYYAVSIPGGVYRDVVQLKDATLPDNKRAFRSMANDRRHTEMVEGQWR